MKHEILYLRNWEYNAARLLSDLETIVNNRDGYIAYVDESGHGFKPYQTKYTLHNRTLMEAIHKEKERVQLLKERGRDSSSREKELERLEAIDAPPLETRFKLSISFILDGIYYKVELPDNPFFEYHYSKIALDQNNQYQERHYLMELEKSPWADDCLLSFTVSPTDIREMAHLLLNTLETGAFSEQYIETTRKRVPNYYDGGYHYENIRTYAKKSYTVKPLEVSEND